MNLQRTDIISVNNPIIDCVYNVCYDRVRDMCSSNTWLPVKNEVYQLIKDYINFGVKRYILENETSR